MMVDVLCFDPYCSTAIFTRAVIMTQIILPRRRNRYKSLHNFNWHESLPKKWRCSMTWSRTDAITKSKNNVNTSILMTFEKCIHFEFARHEEIIFVIHSLEFRQKQKSKVSYVILASSFWQFSEYCEFRVGSCEGIFHLLLNFNLRKNNDFF